MARKASKAVKTYSQRSLFDNTDNSTQLPADNRPIPKFTVNVTSDIYLIPNPPTERAVRAKYVNLAKDVIKTWAACNIPLKYINLSVIQKRLKQLIEEGVTIEQINLAINNYSKSSWNLENNFWKSPITFLVQDVVMQWQTPKVNKNYVTPASELDAMHDMIRKFSRGR